MNDQFQFKKPIRWALSGSILVLFFVLSCSEKNVEESEPSRAPVMEMNYTVTKTNFTQHDGAEKGTPSVSKEKVKFRIFDNDDFTIRVDILDHEVSSFYKTEALPGNDYPIASYYEMMPGRYVLYDTKGKVMSENSMPELDFSSLMKQLKEATTNQASIPALITGGMIYFPLDFNDSKVPTTASQRTKNNYGDAYQIYINTYNNEFDGLPYTQEAIVLKSNNTIEALRLYDAKNKIITSTSFRYEGEGKDVRLKNTQDVAVEKNRDGSTTLLVTLADYEDFRINLNF